MRKIFVLAVVSIVVISSCAFGAQLRGVRVSSEGREIPSDPMLPVYENPKEIDLLRDKLHISFKGAFRGIDDSGKLTDWVYFAFTVKGEKDKYLAVGQSELFDSKGNIYQIDRGDSTYFHDPQITTGTGTSLFVNDSFVSDFIVVPVQLCLLHRCRIVHITLIHINIAIYTINAPCR